MNTNQRIDESSFLQYSLRGRSLCGKPEVLPFSISGATWRKMLSNHKKHKSHNWGFVPFVAISGKCPAAEFCERLELLVGWV